MSEDKTVDKRRSSSDELPLSYRVSRARRRVMGRSLMVALSVHALIAFIVLPETASPVVEARKDEPMNIVRPPIPPKQPPPRQPIRPEREAEAQPVPVPHAEEPVQFAEPAVEPSVEAPSDLPLTVNAPEAPPAPGPDVYSIDSVSVAPVQIKRVQPEYPRALRIAGVQGRVVLAAVISESGEVEEVSVVESSGRSQFDEAAVEAVRQWRYEPARLNSGEVVTVRAQIKVTFRLN